VTRTSLQCSVPGYLADHSSRAVLSREVNCDRIVTNPLPLLIQGCLLGSFQATSTSIEQLGIDHLRDAATGDMRQHFFISRLKGSEPLPTRSVVLSFSQAVWHQSKLGLKKVLHGGRFPVELGHIHCDLPDECRHFRTQQDFAMCSRELLPGLPEHPARIQPVHSLDRSAEHERIKILLSIRYEVPAI
jgi:hypothetical protein